MTKYTKLPVEIDAVKWTGKLSDLDGLGSWPCNTVSQDLCSKELQINTLEGTMTAYPGDYIIKGVKGELYPCKADIFEMTYKPSEGGV